MDASRALSRSLYPIERATLPNGLRVLFAPDRTAPVVAVAIYCDVGMRSEPRGRTGFSHLFEHLMFGGSENLPKMDHFRYIQSAGGVVNGTTRLDYTDYYDLLPSNALERALYLETNRRRTSRLARSAGT
jgi:zinc protease